MNSLVERGAEEAKKRDARNRELEESARASLRQTLASAFNSAMGLKYPNEHDMASGDDVKLVWKSGRHGTGLIERDGFRFLAEYHWDNSLGGSDHRRLWIARHRGIEGVSDPEKHKEDWRQVRSPAGLYDSLRDGWKSFLRRRIALHCQSCGNSWDWEIPITHVWSSLVPCDQCGDGGDVNTGFAAYGKSDPQIRLSRFA